MLFLSFDLKLKFGEFCRTNSIYNNFKKIRIENSIQILNSQFYTQNLRVKEFFGLVIKKLTWIGDFFLIQKQKHIPKDYLNIDFKVQSG